MAWGLDSNPSLFGGKRVLSRTLLLESSTMQWIVNSPQMATCLTLCFPVSSKLISDGRTSSSLLDASNRFYTLIPHDFGMKKPPLLDNLELIKVSGLNCYHFLNTLLLRGERQRNRLNVIDDHGFCDTVVRMRKVPTTVCWFAVSCVHLGLSWFFCCFFFSWIDR